MSRKPKFRKFWVTLVAEVSVAEKALTQGRSREFSEAIGPMNSDEQVVEHIAYNMIRNGIELPQIDGFAEMDPSMARVDDCRVDTVEEDES